jgi:hypothetical protein
VRELIEPLAKTLVNIHLPQPGGLDGDLSNRLQGAVWQMDSGGVYPGLPPSANLIIRVRDHTSASSGAGPMELVSMACPSVVRGRIIIIIISQ